MFICPVCGYSGLRRPPIDHIICPSCGTQFGYSDAGPAPAHMIHAALRKRWIERDARWHSRYTLAPRFWNAWRQLAEAGMAYDIPWLEGLTFSTPVTYT